MKAASAVGNDKNEKARIMRAFLYHQIND